MNLATEEQRARVEVLKSKINNQESKEDKLDRYFDKLESVIKMIDELYHSKQLEVLNFALNNDYFMLINYGAKRTGKTIIDNDLFLLELRRVRKIANELGIKLPQYILAGADLGALQRNVLSELTNKYDIEFKFDKHNRFVLFGVQVCCFGHSKQMI